MNKHLLALLVASNVFFAQVACTKEGSMKKLYYYDWPKIGIKAPSVIGEIEYDTLAFTVDQAREVKPHQSPAVLAPYNVKMDFNLEVTGTLDGKPAVLETASSLLKSSDLKKGMVLELSVGKRQSQNVYRAK